MHTAWRRYAVFAATFTLLALGNVALLVLSQGLTSGAVSFRLFGVAISATAAALFLRQATLRRRAERSSRN